MTGDAKVGDEEEGAEAHMGHFFVCAGPGDPVVTHIRLCPRLPWGWHVDEGRQAAAWPGAIAEPCRAGR